MAKIEFEVDDKIYQSFMNFCTELNMDATQLLTKFTEAIGEGGEAILDIPYHMPSDTLNAMLDEIKLAEESGETTQSSEQIKAIIHKYMN